MTFLKSEVIKSIKLELPVRFKEGPDKFSVLDDLVALVFDEISFGVRKISCDFAGVFGELATFFAELPI